VDTSAGGPRSGFTAQQPAQPQQPAPAMPPPFDPALAGSPGFIEQNPIPAGVQIYVPLPQFVGNDYYDGQYNSGMLSYATITVVDTDGVPIDSPVSYTETALRSTSSSVQVNTNVEIAQDGRIPDRIGLTSGVPRPATEAQLLSHKGYMATRPFNDTTTQMLFIGTSGGRTLTVISDRITSNARPISRDSQGVPNPNYSVTVSITSIKSGVVGTW
jgi:hypothetical protein